MRTYFLVCGVLVGFLLSQCFSDAATVAWWRFEEGVAGQRPPDSNWNTQPKDVILDSSGNANHMRTYFADSAGLYVSDVSARAVRLNGITNNLGMQFAPNQDNFTDSKPINYMVFSAWTIEASVRLNSLDAWQGILVKDGNCGSSLLPPVVLKFREDNHCFQVEVVDGAGEEVSVMSSFTPLIGKWYHLAAVNDGTNLFFYIQAEGDRNYDLQGSTPVSGAWYDNGGQSWSIGRGWYNGITDWIQGSVDEVRVSDTALAQSEFLHTAPALVSAKQGGQLILRWPKDASSYTLEKTLGISAQWTIVTDQPIVLGNEKVIAVPASGTNAFYRLRAP